MIPDDASPLPGTEVHLVESRAVADEFKGVRLLMAEDNEANQFVAEELLNAQGLGGKKFDVLFVRRTIAAAAEAAKAALDKTQPVTHLGVGAAKQASTVRWAVAGNIIIAWVLTFPASAVIAVIAYLLLRPLF